MSYDNDVQSMLLQALLLTPSQPTGLLFGLGSCGHIFLGSPREACLWCMYEGEGNDYSGAPWKKKGGFSRVALGVSGRKGPCLRPMMV